jgi:preprotein translocase subunit YajC
MAELLNHHSYLLVAVVILLVVAFLLLRDGAKPFDFLMLAALLALLAGVWWLIRPDPDSRLAAAEVQAQIGVGQPVLLEFESAY